MNASQPNIEDAVQFALAQSGKPYHAYGDRFGLDYYDCSGLVIRALYEANVPLPTTISVANKYGNTVSLYNWAKDVGGLVSVQKGVATRGAIMIKGKWYGNGPLGHTSISLGDGREMAAHGTFSGIHVSDIYGGRNYQDAFIIPGVFYQALQPPVDPKVLVYLERLTEWEKAVGEIPLQRGDTNHNVTILNNLLILRAWMGKGRKSNTYSKYTQAAVTHLKKTYGLPGGGKKFGGLAAKVLLNPS